MQTVHIQSLFVLETVLSASIYIVTYSEIKKFLKIIINMSPKLSLSEINILSSEEFCHLFGNVVESWSTAAETVKAAYFAPVSTTDELIKKFTDYLETIDDSTKQKILCLHPDLAGRLLDENLLTAESANEQASAGLDKLSKEQKEVLVRLNAEYLRKFGFPFVICVRQNNKIERILAGFEARINNDRAVELNVANEEVKKICALRVRDIVQSD